MRSSVTIATMTTILLLQRQRLAYARNAEYFHVCSAYYITLHQGGPPAAK